MVRTKLIYGRGYPLQSGEDVLSIQIIIMQTGVDFLLYGVQSALFLAALVAMARQDTRILFMRAAVFSLFLSSSVVAAANIVFYLAQTPSFGYDLDRIYNLLLALNIVTDVFPRFNFVLSDAIVAWRAWVLWPDNRWVKSSLILCVIGSLAGVTVDCVWTAQDVMGENSVRLRALMVTMPLLLTNVVATALVAAKVWYYRREIKSVIGSWRKTSQVEKVLVLLLESGCVYCLIWVVRLSIDLASGTGKTIHGYSIIGGTYHSIAGIYPTLIVIAVACQRSATQDLALSTQALPPLEFLKAEDDPTSSLRVGASSAGSLLMATSTPPYFRLQPTDVFFFQAALVEIGVGTAFFGIQLALFVAAMFVSMTHERNRSQRIITLALVILFLFSLAAVVLDIMFYFLQTPTFTYNLDSILSVLFGIDIALQACTRINLLLSDAVVVWRAYYRREIKNLMGPWRKTTRVERVLVLLLESGFGYCFIWAGSIALDRSKTTDENLAASRALGTTYHSIAGIYPTLIVLIVGMQRSAASSLMLSTQVSRSMAFVAGSPGDPMYKENEAHNTSELTTTGTSSSSSDRPSCSSHDHPEYRTEGDPPSATQSDSRRIAVNMVSQ
ncbi:uncharacterized protein SCHCODRAFT_01357952 [Schizophyllum commune H4-8]|nr:uncharacterized protein SCHCODRAFT_01357952 [Schizophyllum commune H4-8]KAI5889533.1 hypothetical protein SCHCODRAFT_01357952 [Schizophyllum commune H4-8]